MRGLFFAGRTARYQHFRLKAAPSVISHKVYVSAFKCYNNVVVNKGFDTSLMLSLMDAMASLVVKVL